MDDPSCVSPSAVNGGSVSRSGDFYHVALSYNTLNLDTYVSFVRSPRAGAISTFVGTTRDTFEEKIVTHLSYEAYVDMAMEQLVQMCQEIRDKYKIINLAIRYSLFIDLEQYVCILIPFEVIN